VSEETEITERMFVEFNRGGFEALAPLIHPDVEFVAFEGWPGPSVYQGVDGWAEATREWTENFDGYRFEVDRVVSVRDGALAFVTSHARIKGEGDRISMPLAVLMAHFEDGRARSVRWFRSWDEAIAAAGLPQPNS
jgi:ketosteroid isomerase-like protein